MSSIKEISFASAASLGRKPKARSFVGAPSTVRTAVSGLVRAVLNRLSANDLRDLDDRMLDDIGLTRADLDDALADAGAFGDPTPGLTRAVRARAWRRFAPRRG
ncbi:DUF1127 domain-containing protein [Rhizobiaceae bacterium BDR2-2]|uniref:DUF1127 domain-containing protein n=1 Tax=Ectorhizobium quercum TaxID=2965071 RepID=A0AAE3MWI8_9HYPH|nr:DUF1127 domain-containing protein [Ectorhizobium quercum]MCX8996268.1 DUF1127 domain-containing protein [Ectorhizobium quercum]MCX8998693.1 DUF1127 domain-containing protein [Ectorhizobium quercum]